MLPLDEDDPTQPLVGRLEIVTFALPLVLALHGPELGGRPIISAALSRTANPDIAMAGFQVALATRLFSTALIYNIYHLVILFVKGQASFRQAKRFATVLGITGLACLLRSSFPILGKWVLEH